MGRTQLETTGARRAFRGAEHELTTVPQVLEEQFGPDSFVAGAAMDRLACHFQASGELSSARYFFERAARIGLGNLENDSRAAEWWLGDLAGLFEEVGAYEEARPILHRVWTLCSWRLGPSHPATVEQRQRLERVTWLSVIRGEA